MFNLKNKKVIVTGATGGIGNAIIKFFVQNEAKVLATGTNEEKLKFLLDQHSNLLTRKFDLSKHEEIEKFIDESTKVLDGGPDILINNAGITKDNLSLRMSTKEWNDVLNINLTSTFLLCKFTLKKMIKNKYGKVVNITSVVGHTGNVGQANYAASKSGIIGFSKSLALEYAKKNININCVSPGFIETQMTDKIDPKFKELIISKIPSNRLGSPEDVANVVAFLSSFTLSERTFASACSDIFYISSRNLSLLCQESPLNFPNDIRQNRCNYRLRPQLFLQRDRALSLKDDLSEVLGYMSPQHAQNNIDG